MEKVINSSTLSNVGATATQVASSSFSTTLIVSISTVAIIVAGFTYYLLNLDCLTSDDDNTVDTNVTSASINIINTEDIKQIEPSEFNNSNKLTKEVISITDNNTIIPSKKVSIETTSNNIELVIEETELFTKSNIDLIENSDATSKDCEEVDINDIVVDELNTEDFNNHLESDKVETHLIQNAAIVNIEQDSNTNPTKEVNTQLVKKDNSEVKNVKPMRNPSGKVFKKKGGIFKWLSRKK
ncbi:MAG: hypothetical protein DRI86_00035 [Bacteroidetes bacterium]|nr:MAG: hypothetical protein DRI86_00035 [Bacteroidota bacterium]